MAQFERGLIRERVAAGMKTAKGQGKPIGRPKKVFDRAEVLRLRQQGLSLAQIARQMHLGHGTVIRVLQAAENRTGDTMHQPATTRT
jgi:DNA invertase Pin-like site-specific DNA recombinase